MAMRTRQAVAGTHRLAALVLLMMMQLVACRDKVELGEMVFKSRDIASYRATIQVTIQGCAWHRASLIYHSSTYDGLAFEWERSKGQPMRTGLEDKVSCTLPRILQREKWVGGKIKSAKQVTVPVGRIELLLDDKKITDFSPDEISGDMLMFHVQYICNGTAH